MIGVLSSFISEKLYMYNESKELNIIIDVFTEYYKQLNYRVIHSSEYTDAYSQSQIDYDTELRKIVEKVDELTLRENTLEKQKIILEEEKKSKSNAFIEEIEDVVEDKRKEFNSSTIEAYRKTEEEVYESLRQIIPAPGGSLRYSEDVKLTEQQKYNIYANSICVAIILVYLILLKNEIISEEQKGEIMNNYVIAASEIIVSRNPKKIGCPMSEFLNIDDHDLNIVMSIVGTYSASILFFTTVSSYPDYPERFLNYAAETKRAIIKKTIGEKILFPPKQPDTKHERISNDNDVNDLSAKFFTILYSFKVCAHYKIKYDIARIIKKESYTGKTIEKYNLINVINEDIYKMLFVYDILNGYTEKVTSVYLMGDNIASKTTISYKEKSKYIYKYPEYVDKINAYNNYLIVTVINGVGLLRYYQLNNISLLFLKGILGNNLHKEISVGYGIFDTDRYDEMNLFIKQSYDETYEKKEKQ